MQNKRNHFVLLGSIVAVLISIIWGIREGGFEPWIVALLGIVGIAANSDLLKGLRGKKRNLTPEQKISARDKWRPEFENYFLESARHNYKGDAIIHDVDRLDTYPNTDSAEGISSWFRVGLMGTYHKGILLGLYWTTLEEKNGEWLENSKANAANSVKVILLGEVPYESIQSVNFDGDDFYNKPHIWCHFEHGSEPYERLFYGEERQLDPGFPHYYSEIAEYKRKPKPSWQNWQPFGGPR